MSLIQRKRTKLGFALQNSEGEDITAAGSFTVWRLPEAESLSEDPAYSFLDWADGVQYQNHYLREVQSVSGSLTLWPIPGGSSDLIDWIITRDSDGQGKWATIAVEFVTTRRKFRDCKCASARLEFTGSGTPMWRMDVTGKFGDTGVDLTSEDAVTTTPYEKHESYIEMKTGGGAYATTNAVHNVTIEIDNQIESAGDGATVNKQLYPQYLANGIQLVTGTFDRRFIDAAVYNDFLNGQEAALKIVCERSAVGTVTLELPRIVYTGQALHAGGDASQTIIEEGVPFTALSSADGTTAPITIAET